MPMTSFQQRLARTLREARDLRHRREESLLAAMVRAHAARRYDDLRMLHDQLRPIYRSRIDPVPTNQAEDEQVHG